MNHACPADIRLGNLVCIPYSEKAFHEEFYGGATCGDGRVHAREGDLFCEPDTCLALQVPNFDVFVFIHCVILRLELSI